MFRDNLNNSNREFKSLQKSYGNWDAGTPSPGLWEDLEADLAVSAVWDRLDESLEASGSSADKTLVESYENWSPNNAHDGWSRLQEELSRERVWTRLNNTLNYPVSTRIPWMKMAAASILFVLVSFYTDRFISTNEQHISPLVAISSENNSPENPGRANSDSRAIVQNPASPDANQVQHAPGELVINNQLLNRQNELIVKGPDNLPVADGSVNNAVNTIAASSNEPETNIGLAQDPGNSPEESTAPDISALNDLADLGRKEITLDPKSLDEFTFLPYKRPFRPKFSVQLGGQFSFINEKNRTAFSSSIPSMGVAGAFEYHFYLKNLRFTQDLGFSQYAQSNGSYVNGRYTNSNQRLNTIYLMSSVGYTYKGVTVYGGITLNRLLNGYEENRSYITNVYNSNKLQVGAAAGIDYHFAPFDNRTAMGVGVQYQFMSRLKSGNAVFDDIQGVKLLIKYSF